MKVIDERGRFFGLLNIVDIIIIAIVVLVVGLGGMFMLNKGKKGGTSMTTYPLSYKVEFQHLNQETVAVIKEGEKVYNSSTYAYLGVIEKAEVVPQKAVIANTARGVYEEHVVPNELTLYLTIKGNGFDNEQSINIEGQNIKIGKQLNVKGKGYAFMGYVVGVNVEAKETAK